MTFDEIYTAVKDGDTESLEEWLSHLEVTPKVLKFIDSLCIHCVIHNQLDVLKLLVKYAANIQVAWTSSFLMEYAIQYGRNTMMDYLRDRVDTERI